MGNLRETTFNDSRLHQHSSTQTDIRDSEIQTDPRWWNRSSGLPLLCYRGSHRKLERAKWIDRLCYSDNLRDLSFEYDLESDPHSASQNQQRNVGCGPSQGSPSLLPDPLEIWVSTYQRLREEDTKLTEKMTEKKNEILNRQKRRRPEGSNKSYTKSSQNSHQFCK